MLVHNAKITIPLRCTCAVLKVLSLGFDGHKPHQWLYIEIAIQMSEPWLLVVMKVRHRMGACRARVGPPPKVSRPLQALGGGHLGAQVPVDGRGAQVTGARVPVGARVPMCALVRKSHNTIVFYGEWPVGWLMGWLVRWLMGCDFG